MHQSVNCRVFNADDEEILSMDFAVYLRESGVPKLEKLYSNFAGTEHEVPALLPEEAVLAATTHEAEVLTLENLVELFKSRGKEALLSHFDANNHIHRDSGGKPFVCWAGFTPSLEEILTIIKA